VAVNGCIQGFSGRSKDTIIIRLKPVSEGYKIWIVADNGYISQALTKMRVLKDSIIWALLAGTSLALTRLKLLYYN
jgi:hypothetical protein